MIHTNFKIRFATKTDLEEIMKLHSASFNPEDYIPYMLGWRYIKATYRWLIMSKKAYTLVASIENDIIGLVSVCDNSYTVPMFIACLPEFIISLILKPSLLINRKLWARLLRRSINTKTGIKIDKQKAVAQMVIGAVASGYRGQGIFPSLVEATRLFSLERGSRAILAGIYKTNSASCKVFIKGGWEICPELETNDTVYYVTYLK